MTRHFEIYIYREDDDFDKRIKPIRTALMSPANIRALKTELDRIGASISETSLAVYMDEVYLMDDIVRAELPVATGKAQLQPAIVRQNAQFLAMVQRKVLVGGQAAHNRFIEDAQA